MTPDVVAARLVEAAGPAITVLDPACGDGALLAAVADADPSARLLGADVDPDAVAVARRRLPRAHLAVADTLATGLGAWPDAPSDGVDLVIANPPFRNQLARRSALSAAERDVARRRVGPVATGYADAAAMFLVAACELAAPTGRVAMILPLSFLSARDAGPARRRALELATLEGLWVAPHAVFPDADVRVCAVVLDRGGRRRRSVRRWVGERFDPLPSTEVDSDALRDEPTWGHLAAAALGVPEVELRTSGAVGDLAVATAGFRQQFYGLAPHVRDVDPSPPGDEPRGSHRRDGPPSPPGDGELAPLVTVGLVEPGSIAWGRRPTRLAGTRYAAPAVDLAALAAADHRLAHWVDARRTRKLVVATQTAVLEAAPDPIGDWVPSTPLVSLHPDTAGDELDLWRLLAALHAPPLTAHALARHAGAALSAHAVKLSARQVTALPLPADRRALDRAAAALRRAHRPGAGVALDAVVDVGPALTAAYGADPSVTDWWLDRLPTPAGAAPRRPPRPRRGRGART
jgi:hypothetical protein